MPSLEVLCKSNNMESLEFPHFCFEIVASRPPRSHRNPSLFQSYIDKNPVKNSTLYHLGFSCDNGWFYAYDIIDMNDDASLFGINKDYFKDFEDALALMFKKSYEVEFFFDYQFSPGPATFSPGVDYDRFLTMASACQLVTNSCYRFRGNEPKAERTKDTTTESRQD